MFGLVIYYVQISSSLGDTDTAIWRRFSAEGGARIKWPFVQCSYWNPAQVSHFSSAPRTSFSPYTSETSRCCICSPSASPGSDIHHLQQAERQHVKEGKSYLNQMSYFDIWSPCWLTVGRHSPKCTNYFPHSWPDIFLFFFCLWSPPHWEPQRWAAKKAEKSRIEVIKMNAALFAARWAEMEVGGVYWCQLIFSNGI